MTDLYQIALDTLKAGAPGLSDQTKEVLAGSIARKATLSSSRTSEPEAREAVAWERLRTTGSNQGWIPVDPEDIAHYRSVGQEIRALAVITHPAPATADNLREPECSACLDKWAECNTCGGSHKNDPRWSAEKLKRIAKGLDTAISWVDYPFIDNNTPEEEIKQRLGFMMKDAEPHRAALATLSPKEEGGV